MSARCGRFAPSTSGPPHLGTLLAALLAWCDARGRGGRVVLRLEDLDPQRSRRAHGEALRHATAWLGLNWDAVHWQHEAAAAHQAALRALAAAGRVYACGCSRAMLRAQGAGVGPYPNTCRGRTVAPAALAACRQALRVHLPDGPQPLALRGPWPVAADPRHTTGDPIVRRRDGAIAYMLAGVVDDAAAGVTDVVRGHDLAGCCAPQAALRTLLGLPQVRTRHHLLLCGADGAKLAKSAGAGGWQGGVSAPALCGRLAQHAGLQDAPRPLTPRALLAHFDWERVRAADVCVAAAGAAGRPTQNAPTTWPT